MSPHRHRAFPLAWVTTGKRLLLVCGCREPLCRLRHALAFDWAAISVYLPPGEPALCEACPEDARVTLLDHPPGEEDVKAADLVIEATYDQEALAAELACWCRRHGKPLNAMDKTAHCDFHYPAFLERGPLLLSIASGGEAPALAARLRRHLEDALGPGWATGARLLAETRRRLPAGHARRNLLEQLVSSSEILVYIEADDEVGLQAWIDDAICRM